MNLLLLCPQLPWPPHQGTALRNLSILQHLATRHRLSLATFARPDADLGPLASMALEVHRAAPPPPRPIWRRLFDIPTSRQPDLVRRLDSPAFEAILEQEVLASLRSGEREPFDVLQIEGMEMAGFGLRLWRQLARIQAKPPRLIYDAHNAEWVLQDRAWRADLRRARGLPGALYSLAQTAKIRRFEAALLRQADATVAVSRADAEALRRLAPEAQIIIVPNGVDTAAYGPANPEAVQAERCVFTGKMDFRPNIDAMAWYCAEVWPRVRSVLPEARLDIVGKSPAPRVQALDDPDQGIAVTGAVPEIQPYIARAGLVVVPLRVGGGTRLKVLEAMSMAKAIVATSLAVEGLDLEDGRELRIADEPKAMAHAIVELSRDAEQRARLGRTARDRALRDYRWEALVPRIEALYGEGEAESGPRA